MAKSIRVILVLILLSLMVQVPASASLQDNLVPQDTDQGSVGEVDLEYNEYPQHHYELDTYVDTSGDWMPWNWADGAGKQIYIALMEIINAIWKVNVLLANFTMVIVQEAFELDFVSGVVDEIGTAIQHIAGFNSGGFMDNGLWPLMVTFMLCLVGAWAAYVGMVKLESSRAWGGLISALILFVFSLGFFSNAGKILGGVNDWSSELQSNILAVSASIVNPGASYNKDEGIATIRNQMFDLMVKKPYVLMQYGTAEVDESRVDSMLSIDPVLEAEEREQQAKLEVENSDNSMMSVDGITDRAAFVPLLFIGNSIIGIFLLIMSGSIILFQLIFLALALFAPVPLLMALMPRWQQTAVDWAMKLLHAQLMKIAIALLLTILFGISAILYRATESSDLGYLGMMVLQIICFVGIWAKRRDLFSMVSTAANHVQSSTGQTLQNYRRKYSQARNTVRQGKMMLDGKKGRIRHQALAKRNQSSKPQEKIGYLDQKQLANRQNHRAQSKEQVRASQVAMGDREHHDGKEGEEAYKNQLNHRATIENTPSDKEQLADRRVGSNKTEHPPTNDNVTTIEELRRRRLETGSLKKQPLVDRQSMSDAQRESAASIERPDTQDVELTDRQKSQRNINFHNEKSHQDHVNEKQTNQLSERCTLDTKTDRKTSQDVVNRNQTHHQSTERTINDVTETKNDISEENRHSQENITKRENVSRNINRRNEQTVHLDDKQENISRIIENAKQSGKHLTKWEANQQIKARKSKNDDK